MKTVNEVKLAGHAGRDAETRFTGGGKSISKFSIATGGGKSKDGREYPTEWHNIEMWESADAREIRKGDFVELTGRLKTNSWDDRTTGKKVYQTVVVAQTIKVEAKEPREPKPLTPPSYSNTEITDDDIPF